MIKIYATTAIALACMSWGLFCLFEVIRASNHTTSPDRKFLSYTIISALISCSIATYVWVMSVIFQHQPLYSTLFDNPISGLTAFTHLFLGVATLWSFTGFYLLFTCGARFPSFSGFGSFTLSYLLLFSILLVVLLILLLNSLKSYLVSSLCKVHP